MVGFDIFFKEEEGDNKNTGDMEKFYPEECKQIQECCGNPGEFSPHRFKNSLKFRTDDKGKEANRTHRDSKKNSRVDNPGNDRCAKRGLLFQIKG